MLVLTCPLCKAQISLVSNMKANDEAINGHVAIHAEKMRSKKASKTQILKVKHKVEDALIIELVKEIYNYPLLSPPSNAQTKRKTLPANPNCIMQNGSEVESGSCVLETTVIVDDAEEEDLVSQVVNEVLATDSMKSEESALTE